MRMVVEVLLFPCHFLDSSAIVLVRPVEKVDLLCTCGACLVLNKLTVFLGVSAVLIRVT